MKSIAVVGPDQDLAAQIASKLNSQGSPSFRAIAGATPADNPDGVIAVVGAPTEADRDVVGAIRASQGTVVIYSTHRWPDQPGVIACRVPGALTDPEALARLQDLAGELWLDRRQWHSDVHRADADRRERVAIAVRLVAQRVSSELMELPDSVPAAELHAAFLTQLRLAVLRQGVEFPHVDEEMHVSERKPTATFDPVLALTVAASLAGGMALGLGVGRATGVTPLGIAVGLAFAVTLAGLRLVATQRNNRRAHVERERRALREEWAALVTEVATRMSVPRVADQLTPGAH